MIREKKARYFFGQEGHYNIARILISYLSPNTVWKIEDFSATLILREVILTVLDSTYLDETQNLSGKFPNFRTVPK